MADPVPFEQDTVHASYDPAAVQDFWRALVQVDRVFKQFRGRFLGKASPVHFFWGGFDLAVTRFSGRRAPMWKGATLNVHPHVMHESYSHEVSSAGFWLGTESVPAVFYSYAVPEPDGYRGAPVEPGGGAYSQEIGEFMLPYEVVRTAPVPDDALRAFLESTYAAAADLGHWDRGLLEERPASRLLQRLLGSLDVALRGGVVLLCFVPTPRCGALGFVDRGDLLFEFAKLLFEPVEVLAEVLAALLCGGDLALALGQRTSSGFECRPSLTETCFGGLAALARTPGLLRCKVLGLGRWRRGLLVGQPRRTGRRGWRASRGRSRRQDPEAGVGGRLYQASAAHFVGDLRIGQGRGEGLLRLACRGVGDPHAGLRGQCLRLAQQGRLQLPTLSGEAAELFAGRAGLSAAQLGGELEELLHDVALAAPQQIHEPRALRWFA